VDTLDEYFLHLGELYWEELRMWSAKTYRHAASVDDITFKDISDNVGLTKLIQVMGRVFEGGFMVEGPSERNT